MIEPRFVRKVKRPSGASGLWSAYAIEEDAQGTWWFAHVYGAHDPGLFRWAPGASVAEPGRRAVSIDICRPAEAGAVVTADEDEFADAVTAGVIGADEAEASIHATDDLRARLEHRSEPFASIAWDKLEAALDLHLEPIELPDDL